MKSMMLHKFIFACSLLFLTGSVAIADTDVIISNQSGESMIEGKILDIAYDEMLLKLDSGTEVSVEIDDLNLDGNYFRDYFPEGTHVRVMGHFSHDEFRAENIMMNSDDVVIGADGN